jgi:hypothetical protein
LSNPLSPLLRVALLACVLLSGIEGLAAANEALTVSQVSSDSVEQEAGAKDFAHELNRALIRAEKGFGDSRAALLTLEALACAFVFVVSLRMFRPGPLPRDGIRRLVVWGTGAAAFLRTMDGAQEAVLMRRAVSAWLTLPGASWPGMSAESFAQARPMLPSMASSVAAGLTAATAGLFALLCVYFASQGVKALVASPDPKLEQQP